MSDEYDAICEECGRAVSLEEISYCHACDRDGLCDDCAGAEGHSCAPQEPDAEAQRTGEVGS